MISDILFIISLSLECLLLIFLIKYTIKYFKQYQEKVDKYTKWTLILLSVAMFFQVLRMPNSIINIALEVIDDPSSPFTVWANENTPNLNRI